MQHGINLKEGDLAEELEEWVTVLQDEKETVLGDDKSCVCCTCRQQRNHTKRMAMFTRKIIIQTL